jgi:phosphopantothenoylcysteine decarboxylase
MLQSVGSEHDNHYVTSQSNSIDALVAARNDGKKHLLLAYAHHTAHDKHTVTLTCRIQSIWFSSNHQEQAHPPNPLPPNQSRPLTRIPPTTVPVIVQALAKYAGTLSIRIVLTESATHFLGGQSAEQPTISTLQHMPNVDAVYRDRDEWGPQPWRRGASILHIE